MTSNKKPRKKSANESQKGPLPAISDFETETANKEPADQEERLLAAATLTKSSRSTRTRSRKNMLLMDFSEPKAKPLLSPPLVKDPKKVKGISFYSLLSYLECTA